MTREELYHFDLKGYLLVKRAFEPDLICALNDRLRDLEGLGRDRLPPRAIPNWTPVVNEYRIMNIVECGEPFVQLIDHPQILQRVEALVPPPIRLTEAYSISRKRGIGVPLHSVPIAEYAAGRSGPSCKHLTAVVNLTECGPEDGPLVVFEGTHKLGVPFPYSPLHPDWPAPSHDREVAAAYARAVPEHARPVPWEKVPGYKEVCVEAGDLILFTEDLWHGAKELRSGRARRTLYFAYSPYHFTNWHGVESSEELKRQVTERQRELLSGPFIGYRYDGADVASSLPAGLPFQSMPNSERAGSGWRSPVAASEPATGDGRLGDTVREIFEHRLGQRMSAHPELALHRSGICQFTVSGEGGGTWCIDLSGDGGTVHPGEHDRPDCVVEVGAEDFVALVNGAADPVELFYLGRLSIRGDVSLAMRMASLWGA